MTNWIAACNTILGMDVDVVVPGHGPVTDKHAVSEMRDYLQFVIDESGPRFDAGMSATDTAFDIPLGKYAQWGDAERIVVTVATLHAERRGEAMKFDPVPLFAQMSRMRCQLRACACHGGALRAD